VDLIGRKRVDNTTPKIRRKTMRKRIAAMMVALVASGLLKNYSSNNKKFQFTILSYYE
jgi:hypothetical protein